MFEDKASENVGFVFMLSKVISMTDAQTHYSLSSDNTVLHNDFVLVDEVALTRSRWRQGPLD